jgi:MATE family multidrug resistance protein
MGAAWMGASAISMLVLGETFIGLFADDATVIALVMTLLPVAAVFQVADGVQAVAFGVLRGVGDTRVPALMNIVAYWVVGLPIGWWVGLHVTGTPGGVWTGLVVGLVVVAVLMLGRMWRVAGRPTQRVESTPPAP